MGKNLLDLAGTLVWFPWKNRFPEYINWPLNNPWKFLNILDLVLYLHPEKSITDSGCSVARLSRLVWDEEVAGSNPATPTKKAEREFGFFLLPQAESSLSRRRGNKKKEASVSLISFFSQGTPFRITDRREVIQIANAIMM